MKGPRGRGLRGPGVEVIGLIGYQAAGFEEIKGNGSWRVRPRGGSGGE